MLARVRCRMGWVLLGALALLGFLFWRLTLPEDDFDFLSPFQYTVRVNPYYEMSQYKIFGDPQAIRAAVPGIDSKDTIVGAAKRTYDFKLPSGVGATLWLPKDPGGPTYLCVDSIPLPWQERLKRRFGFD